MADIDTIIEVAAGLVDNGQEVTEEYRRGVVELAAQLCLHADDPLYHDDAITVMGYAVCGVNRTPDAPGPKYCTKGVCILSDGHDGACI